MSERSELVILGGGCAGLSLARQLAILEKRGHAIPETTILEPREDYVHDRTWCFWQPAHAPVDTRITCEWDRWSFSESGGNRIFHEGGEWRYRCLPSGRFYREATRWIQASSRIRLQSATPVLSATDGEDGDHRIETTGGSMKAAMVVDTRPPATGAKPVLLQQFIGVEGEGPLPMEDPACVGLMDNMRQDEHGFLFHYLLPFSENRFLLEVTRFTPEKVPWDRMEKDLAAAQQEWGFSRTVETRREKGIIPMGLPMPKQPAGPRWAVAGTRGGAIRPATGYAFQRIAAWAESCARAIVENGCVLSQPCFPRSIRWMDDLFLRLLRRKPELGPQLFMRFAGRLSPGQSVRFLSNKPNLYDKWRVVRSLPAQPFLEQLWRQV